MQEAQRVTIAFVSYHELAHDFIEGRLDPVSGAADAPGFADDPEDPVLVNRGLDFENLADQPPELWPCVWIVHLVIPAPRDDAAKLVWDRPLGTDVEVNLDPRKLGG